MLVNEKESQRVTAQLPFFSVTQRPCDVLVNDEGEPKSWQLQARVGRSDEGIHADLTAATLDDVA